MKTKSLFVAATLLSSSLAVTQANAGAWMKSLSNYTPSSMSVCYSLQSEDDYTDCPQTLTPGERRYFNLKIPGSSKRLRLGAVLRPNSQPIHVGTVIDTGEIAEREGEKYWVIRITDGDNKRVKDYGISKGLYIGFSVNVQSRDNYQFGSDIFLDYCEVGGRDTACILLREY